MNARTLLPSLGALLTVAALSATRADALPRYSLISGTRCSACHFDPQGGGMRNDLGWNAIRTVGALDADDIGLGGLKKITSNSFFDGMLSLGLDVRYEGAVRDSPVKLKQNLLNDSLKLSPRFFFMQATPYLAIAPFDMLTFYGSYNFINPGYPGQARFSAAALFQPGVTAPSLKIGYIQPTFGVRPDDHTMFNRMDAIRNKPILPPFYNELGAEVMYEGTPWLSASAGVFRADNLAKADRTVDPGRPSFAARIMFWPQIISGGEPATEGTGGAGGGDDIFGSDSTGATPPNTTAPAPKPASILRINGEVGGSLMVNGSFRAINAFAGVGLADVGTLYGELFVSRNELDTATQIPNRDVRNISLVATYQAWTWLTFEARYEHGTTTYPRIGTQTANAIVAGVEFFPIPFFELRPEIRYFKGDGFGSVTQLAIQFHAFY